jgi:hypothetical protein
LEWEFSAAAEFSTVAMASAGTTRQRGVKNTNENLSA